MNVISLSGFLVRRHISPMDVLSAASSEQAKFYSWDGAKLIPLTLGDGIDTSIDFVLSTFSNATGPSSWETFIVEAFSPPDFSPSYGKSLGALVFVRVSESPNAETTRWVCWAFGSAARSLQRRAVEPRFGLFAALNRLARADEVGLRQLEYRSFGAYRQRTGHTAGRDTPLDGFRIDPVIDLLSGVGGRAGEASDQQVYGSRSLRLRTSVVTTVDLRKLAQKAIEDSRSHDYRDEFAFIDDFVPVDDEEELDAVRTKLTELILAQDERVDAVIPDDLVGYEDPQAIQYVLLPRERSDKESRVNLTTSNLAKVVSDDGSAGLDREIRFLDVDRALVASMSVLGCTAADFELNGERYVVSDGEFYRVDPAFVDRIDNSLAGLQASSLAFPGYSSGTEATWIASAAEHSHEFVNLDTKLINLPGETSFEAADLIHSSGVLIHAKRKGRSSALSYAMVQARRSCQVLPSVADAREQLYDLVREHAASNAIAKKTLKALSRLESTPPSLPVALVFLGPPPKRGLQGLPLLAKLELSDTRRQIDLWGFHLSAEHVGV